MPMATRAGFVVTGSVGEVPLDCTKGRFTGHDSFRADLGNTVKRYYKLQASNANAPNGIVTWINDNGTVLLRPVYAGPYGDTEIIETWTTEQ